MIRPIPVTSGEYRFVIAGGWEQTLPVEHRGLTVGPPDRWRVREVPPMKPFWKAKPDDPMPKVIERVFQREEIRDQANPLVCEFVFLEHDVDPMVIRPHECAELKLARQALKQFATSARRALRIFEEHEGTFAATTFLCGGNVREELTEIEAVKAELAALVAMTLPRETELERRTRR